MFDVDALRSSKQARKESFCNRTLNILVIGDVSEDFGSFVRRRNFLMDYLDEQQGNLYINLLGVGDNLNAYGRARLLDVPEINYANIRQQGLEHNIDILFDPNSLIDCDETRAYNVEFAYVTRVESLVQQCEAFVIGNGIPWAMEDGFLEYNDWTMIYFHKEGIAKRAFFYMSSLQGKDGLETPEKEQARHLANRFSQIEYSRQLLKFSAQLKRRERRITQSHYAVGFEANYHLGSYYFLIAGAFDMLARYINKKYNLGIKKYINLAVEKPKFIETLLLKDSTLAAILSEEKFSKWLQWLKQRRNYIAHDGAMSITSIVSAPKERMSEQEVEAIVATRLDWDYLATFMSEEGVAAQKETVRELIRQDELVVELEDVMLLRDPKSDKIFSPLNAIDYDYNHFNDAMNKVYDHFIKVEQAP